MSRRLQTVLTVLAGVALVASLFGFPFAYWSVAFGSVFALRAAYRAVVRRDIDVNVLMVLAAAGSVALGHPVEAAVLLFLFSLSSTMEEYAMSRTKSAIAALIKLKPDTALLVGAEGDRKVPVSELKPGDRVRVLPFQLVPVDGKIVQGETTIDQSAMTGESVPVPKAPGDGALAGTMNQDSMVVVEVSRAVGDTTLEQIVELVRQAHENKASGERVSQWFGQTYTFLVIGATLLSVVVRIAMGHPTETALFASLTLLVALSPCALVISTPAATLSALAWAARHGILVRGGEFIEAAGTVDRAAFDKTGTLTIGRPSLREVCVCAREAVAVGAVAGHGSQCWAIGEPISGEASQMLSLAASVEEHSTHPLARAVVQGALDLGLSIPTAVQSVTMPGLGVSAEVDGKSVVVGQPRLYEREGGLPPEVAESVREMQSRGLTVAVVREGDSWAALGLGDTTRSEAKAVLGELRTLGVSPLTMLTGDNPLAAQVVAEKVGVDEVRAGLMPMDKQEIVHRMAGEGKGVVFVGDGANDAPSLAQATVGVAMGGLGSDAALEAADVVLMQDNLRALPDLVRLGRMANGIIRANLVFAGVVIGSLTVISFVFPVMFPDRTNLVLPLAVIGHEGSTVVVILNGLRLLRGPSRKMAA
ncbi:MAG: cation-translocating P-type ATPase [Fimbriimonadaceae bacterium]|nr:cation-translocating P-type ATPase [Fimbriimonadaceae bacterium]QYK59616.1 MAG: cation-translocating P-type ATPase [Fimbriimonadaceae bacterium]